MMDLRNGFPSLWSVYSPVRVAFGPGSLDQLGKMCGSYGRSAILVTGMSAVRTGLSERCLNLLQQAGVRVAEYHSVTPEPTVHQVNEIAEIVRASQTETLVAVGGGSAMDAAKSASVVAAQGGCAEQYLTGERPVAAQSLPVIAVPTTAGTGAELSRGAILSWPERLLKSGIRGDAVFPRAAIIDPQLTLTLPQNETSVTGFDIFTHAVETYISRDANPVTAMLSRSAVEAVCRFLPHVLENPQDLEARSSLSLHSTLMGFNLANSSNCLPHRLQYPLGVLTKSAHAVGLAALYPAWITTTYEAARERFDDVAGLMALGMGVCRANIFQCLDRFMHKINLNPTLRDLGADEAMCARLATMVSGKLDSDPWWHNGADIASIYLLALDRRPGARLRS